MLLYTGTGKDLRPIYFPGFGNGGKTFTTGLNYFIVWNIPYKKINVIIKKEVPEETEETVETGNVQQNTGIRQQAILYSSGYWLKDKRQKEKDKRKKEKGKRQKYVY